MAPTLVASSPKIEDSVARTDVSVKVVVRVQYRLEDSQATFVGIRRAYGSERAGRERMATAVKKEICFKQGNGQDFERRIERE